MNLRPYDSANDYPDVEQIWKDVGWIQGNNSEFFQTRLEAGRGYVGELDGKVESLVTCAPASFQYLKENIPSVILTGVTTSLTARKSGIGSRLTAHSIARESSEADLMILCMFDQGFYDRIGFGTGPYENYVKFHPAHLKVPDLTRNPKRLDISDYEKMHQNHLHRLRGHGKISFQNPLEMKVQALEKSNSFGIGFEDGPNGALSHHVWFFTENMEDGPFFVRWMAYETWDQFLELLSVMKSFGDQIKLIVFPEPAEIQMQDLLDKPFHQSAISRKGPFMQSTQTVAERQYRICNLENVLEKTGLGCNQLQFQLKLSDPIEQFLDESNNWTGISGDYVITLGETCRAEKGTDSNLKTVETSVGAFTRLWMGAASATSLSVTDQFKASGKMIEKLDQAFRLPSPIPDLDF